MSSTAFQTLKRISDSPSSLRIYCLWEETSFEHIQPFSSLIFFKIYFCHQVRTQHKLIRGEKKNKKEEADLLLNWEQRWSIMGWLEAYHYSHFGLETLTGKHHHVLSFIFADVATSGGETEASLRAVWGWDERACQRWYPDNGNAANSGIRVNSN